LSQPNKDLNLLAAYKIVLVVCNLIDDKRSENPGATVMAFVTNQHAPASTAYFACMNVHMHGIALHAKRALTCQIPKQQSLKQLGPIAHHCRNPAHGPL
jgi:hypothetical protein